MNELTCYHPMIRCEERGVWLTNQQGKKYQKPHIFTPERLEDYDNPLELQKYTKFTRIPCGKCIGCRLDYSREWANRGYLEALQYEQNWFITLTYDEDHIYVPEFVETDEGIAFTEEEYDDEWAGCLVPKDLELFLKNLRQIMKREYDQEGIRYMACGEYGSELRRPHYHLIVFNLNLPSETFYEPHIKPSKGVMYKNTIIDRAWGKKGICEVEEANWENIAYTARYITKKQKGKESSTIYAIQGEIPEFFRVSNRPGIAWQYYEDHKQKIYETDQIMIVKKKGVEYIKPPRYFDRLLEKENPDLMKKVKQKRKQDGIWAARTKDQSTSLSRIEQLAIEERTKTESTSTLRRDWIEKGS